jgi:hypothetical protein
MAGWGATGFGSKGTGEMPGAQAGSLRERLDCMVLVQVLAHPGKETAIAAVRCFQFEQGGKLRLPAASTMIEHKLTCHLL